MGVHADISAPQATATDPLKLTFAVYAPALPSGRYVSDLGIFRNGALVGDCAGSTVASPDPCITSRSYSGSTVTFTVLTSHASAWDVMAATSGRLAGADRYGTAVAVSKGQFADHAASAVVLATGVDYPDALVAAPVAKAKNAPLLLTHGSGLSAPLKAEIARVLPTGSTVYVVGGSAAVSPDTDAELRRLGYAVKRVSGNDRFSTATAVAELLGRPTTVLLATGTGFSDALTAGVAAAKTGATVLLTNGSRLPSTTAGYLKSIATTTYAVGGPAAAAAPSATDLVGQSRYETAVAVAQKFFPEPTSVGVATGQDFPDALTGGALLARAGAPLVLTAASGPNTATVHYLAGINVSVTSAHLFGGSSVISDAAARSITTALRLK